MASTTHTPQKVFIHLLGFSALYTAIVQVITLLFNYIDVLFPDPLSYHAYGADPDSVRRAASVLLVVWPVFVGMSFLALRMARAEAAKTTFRLKKWLTYLTLFVAAVTMVVDLSVLLYNFWGGDLSLPFFFKTLVVLFLAALVFGYYLWEDRSSQALSSPLPRRLSWGLSLGVIAVIVSGFFIIGSPFEQRQRRFDERRLNDLVGIQTTVFDFWSRTGALPADLAVLNDDLMGYRAPQDPATNEPYEYRILETPLTFELCASFLKVSEAPFGKSTVAVPYPRSVGSDFENWSHGSGRHCFIRTINPEKYGKTPPIF